MTQPTPAVAQAIARAAPLIEARGLGHRYRSATGRTHEALSELSFAIDAGEFVCLLGPSGCGKTTLLNMLAGFIAPGRGELTVAGRPVDGPSAQCGVVFQDYSLFPWLTVQSNVEFGLRMAGRGAQERRELARRYLSLVGLSHAGARYPFELSGGMKQRVAIARALANDPQVLLLDEPFAALDAMTRSELQKQLLEIHGRERKTIVFVTHNIGEAIFLASRVVVLSPHPGRIVEDFRVDLPHPRRRTSAEFNAIHERLSAAIGLEVSE